MSCPGVALHKRRAQSGTLGPFWALPSQRLCAILMGSPFPDSAAGLCRCPSVDPPHAGPVSHAGRQTGGARPDVCLGVCVASPRARPRSLGPIWALPSRRLCAILMGSPFPDSAAGLRRCPSVDPPHAGPVSGAGRQTGGARPGILPRGLRCANGAPHPKRWGQI